jgi:hypothetical protein
MFTAAAVFTFSMEFLNRFIPPNIAGIFSSWKTTQLLIQERKQHKIKRIML